MRRPGHVRISCVAASLALAAAGASAQPWQPGANITRLGAGADAGGAVLAVDAAGRIHLLVNRAGQKIWAVVIEDEVCSPPVELAGGVSPSLAADGQGRVHAAWSEGWEIRYRQWDGEWTAGTALVSAGTGGSNKPHICVDAQNNVHAVWGRDGVVWYNRRSAAAGQWEVPAAVPGTEDLEGYFSPRVAAVGTSPVILFGKHNGGNWTAWFATRESGAWVNQLLDGNAGCSNGDLDVRPDGTVEAAWDRGSDIHARRRANGVWQPLELVRGGVVQSLGPRVASSAGERTSLVWRESQDGAGSIWYSRRTTGGWEPPAVLSDGGGVGPEVCHDRLGRAYAAWSQGWDIWLSVEGSDATAPAAPSDLQASVSGNQCTLTWVNPRVLDLQRVAVVVRTDRPPAHPADGSVLVDRAAEWGGDGAQHVGLSLYATYHYAVFLGDDAGLFSTPARAIVSGPTVRADYDADRDVDLEDFGFLQACLSGPYVPQPDPRCAKARLDQDDDVDQDDIALFLRCFGAAGTAANPDCLQVRAGGETLDGLT